MTNKKQSLSTKEWIVWYSSGFGYSLANMIAFVVILIEPESVPPFSPNSPTPLIGSLVILWIATINLCLKVPLLYRKTKLSEQKQVGSIMLGGMLLVLPLWFTSMILSVLLELFN